MLRRPHMAVLLLSFGLMLYELGLTRILSTLYYHHTAFLALSVAFLGLGFGAFGLRFLAIRSEGHAFKLVLATGLLSTLFPFLIPLVQLGPEELGSLESAVMLRSLLITLLATALPFITGGAALALIFQSRARDFARLYAFDLVGAALATLAMIPTMEFFGGPESLFVATLFMLLAAVMLDRGTRRALAIFSCIVVAGLGLLVHKSPTFSIAIEFKEDDFGPESGAPPEILFQKWNAFSRVALIDNAGWDRGLSSASLERASYELPEQREALIDVNAFAPLVRFRGDLDEVAVLRDLVSNLGYRVVPPEPRVAIIGPGGGKDVLGALLFDAASVLGIELNPILVNDLVLGEMREFCGDLYRHPRVEIVVGDARSELERRSGPFDIIIANSVATWAAQGTGAMNLTEQQIFTREAFELYARRLADGGLFSVSLWDEAEHSVPLRLVSTWQAALGAENIDFAMIGNPWDAERSFVTVLLKKGRFRDEERETLAESAIDLGFDLLYVPGFEQRSDESIVAFARSPDAVIAASPHDLSPATDDRPFLFYTLRLSEALRFWRPMERSDNAAYVSLVASLFLVTALVLLFLVLPMSLARRRGDLAAPTRSEGLYFGLIGFAFMTIEVGLIQKLTVVLGQPGLALVIALGGLLVWTGLGSLMSSRLLERCAPGRRAALLVAATLVLVAFYLLAILPALTSRLVTEREMIRAGGLFLSLAWPGLAMGWAMPAGLAAVRERNELALPFAFGLNCATSVIGSVSSLLVAVLFGFRVSLGLGLLAYALAACAMLVGQGPDRGPSARCRDSNS